MPRRIQSARRLAIYRLLLRGSSEHPGAHIRQNRNQHTQHHHTAYGNDCTEAAPAEQEVSRNTAIQRKLAGEGHCNSKGQRDRSDRREQVLSSSESPLRGQSLKRLYRRPRRGAPPMLENGLTIPLLVGILAHAPRRQWFVTYQRCGPTVGFDGRTTHGPGATPWLRKSSGRF